MNHLIRFCFFIFVRIFVLVILGLNVRRKHLLPKIGPAIIVANHNSHLDTIVLISLFPLKLLPRLRPVAAADYFLQNKYLAWFAIKVIGIIPVTRGSITQERDPLKPCHEALENKDILILFPEGTRGEPEKFSELKKGVAWLVEKHHHVPVTPVFMHGLGKSMGKSDYLPVPFFCDVFVDQPLFFEIDRALFMTEIRERFERLIDEGNFKN